MGFGAVSGAAGSSRSRRALLGLAQSVAAAGLLAACGALLAPMAADAATTGSISGKVTSAATHGALEHIQVCAIQEINEHEFRTAGCKETDAEGKYSISVEPGSYKVEFRPAFVCGIGGCKQANYITQYYSDKRSLSSADPVNVEAGKTVEGTNAEMQAGGQITGKVTGAATHGALEHIMVCVLEPEGAFIFYGHCTETGSEGKYTISGLATAKDLVEFSPGFECEISKCRRLNYITQYWNGKSSFGAAESVSVEAGKTVEGINAEMQVGGQITGKVTSGGTAIERTVVCAVPSTVGRSECELTNSKGEYTIVGLASGKYKVEFTGFTCPEHGGTCPSVYVTQYYNDKSTLGAAESVSVEAGKMVEGINAEMVPTAATTPVNTAAPVLSGTPRIGEALHCSQGTWENEPTGYAYKWLRDGTEIAGQTAIAYTVQAADEGHEISCEVKATNSAGSASKASSTVRVESTKPTPGGGGGGGGPTTGGGGASSGSTAGNSASGGGSNAGSGGVKAAHETKSLTLGQKRANAIAACRKLKKSKRAKCVAAAKKRYPLNKHNGHKKTKKR